jgi:hypothetical protein
LCGEKLELKFPEDSCVCAIDGISRLVSLQIRKIRLGWLMGQIFRPVKQHTSGGEERLVVTDRSPTVKLQKIPSC